MTSRQPAVAPPSDAMNSRRLISITSSARASSAGGIEAEHRGQALDTAPLRFWGDASRHASLADLYCAFGMVLLRGCYHQILSPRRYLPKFANGRCRHSDVWVRLDPHLSWQAPKSYVQRGNAFGLVSHQGSLFVQNFCAARAGIGHAW